MIVKDWCSYCGECAGVCPKNLIEVKEYSLVINGEECASCEICLKACPLKALEKE
ncbi:4Fe-4S binding protein [Methanobrevibacter sp. DSM 116169]|uniref:4Fe-4S binding protein n=1 Tax=Methanobrevibacter sp. DSM 116169 TaxID=3242727 RepID=UPI0038FCBCAB